MRRQYVLFVTVACALACNLMACGHDSLPPDVAARVGNREITKAELARRVEVRLHRRHPGGEGTSAEQADLTRLQLLQTLIRAEWIEQEASKRRVVASKAEVEGWYAGVKAAGDRARAARGDDSAYRAALAEAKGIQQARRSAGRADVLRTKILDKDSQEHPVTEAQIRSYYEKNKDRYVQPERRDLYLVLTHSRERAYRAKQAIANGQSWKAVIANYSVNIPSRQHRTWRIATTQDELDPTLGDATYTAREGDLGGPLKTPAGWYVFEVARIFPQYQQSMEDARVPIEAQLVGQGSQGTAAQLDERLFKEYRRDTYCSNEFEVPECGSDSD
jgi:foldase protein PrsA